MIRGQTCFTLGDVARGTRYWRDIEPHFLELIWRFNSQMESYYQKGAVEDPRYQSLLDDMGVGQSWKAYLHKRVIELEQITGITGITFVRDNGRG
jgi:hypothetical protein